MSNARILANTINSSSQIVVPSGGVNFGTDTDGSGTVAGGVLDDYEEGSWTLSNGTFTTFTSVTGTAKYIKIGNLVVVNFFQTAGTIDPGGSPKYLVGLPFVPDSAGGSGSWSDSSVTINVTGLITASGVEGRIWTPVDFGSTTSLYFSGFYYTS